nr:multidrug effflux MFS transporter [Pseudomonas sp.]
MGLLTMTAPLAIDMYLPAFPDIESSLATPAGAVERTLAVYLIGVALGQLAYGPLSDRFGRKPPLYVGIVLFGLACVGCATAQSIESLTAWRIVQALGGSACMVVPRAVIRDHYGTQGAARAMSLMMLIIGVAPMLAPIAGAQLLKIADWRAIFWSQAALAFGLLLAMHFLMAESLVRDPAHTLGWRAMGRTYRSLLGHRQFMCMALSGGFGMSGLFAYITGSPYVLIQVYGVSPQTYSLLFALNALSMIVASQINGRLLVSRYPTAVMSKVLVALPVITLSALALSLADLLPLPALLACLMGVMACQGFIGPNSGALALAQQGGRLGAASALLGTLQFLCATVIGFGVSLVRTQDATGLVLILALCGILAFVFGRKGIALTEVEPVHAPRARG